MGFSANGTRLGAVAACGLALAAGRDFYDHSIAPLRQRKTETLLGVADLRSRIDSAEKAISEIRDQERDAGRTRSELERLGDDLPPGSVMVWFPALVKDHFARIGAAVPVVRVNTTLDEPDIPGYERSFWFVGLPIDEAGRNIMASLLAVVDLDQQNPLLSVLDFAVCPDPDDPTRRLVAINVAVLAPKAGASR